MQSNIFNKFKKIIISFLVIIIAMQGVCFADFDDTQQEGIYTWVTTFVDTNNTGYTLDIDALNAGYNRIAVEAEYKSGSNHYKGQCYWFCCATWVSFIFKEVFKGDVEVGRWHATDNYAKPDGTITKGFRKITTTNEAQLEAGDLLFWGLTSDGKYYQHMGMYIGHGMATDCSSNRDTTYGKKSNNERAGCYVRPLSYYGTPLLVLRYDKDAEGVFGIDYSSPLQSVIENLNFSTLKYREVYFREVNPTEVDENKVFEYQGIGKVESIQREEYNVGDDWRFPTLSTLLDWILNFIVTIIKALIVGFATLVQVLVTFYIDAASGEAVDTRLSEGMMAYFTSGGLREDIAKSVTMEKIVYNQVPLFDVDVFNGNIAGGETLDSSSIVIKIREVVAMLYMGLRSVSLIGLLLALIYYGIKFVITGIAEEKAECKQKLISWAIAFFIIFGMHYFLIAVMKINEILVGMFSDIGKNIASELSDGQYFDLATAMRELTYKFDAVKSLLAAFLYLAMVYYLVKFVIIYFKRLFVTVILILFAPIVGIKFAMDKLKFKESSTLTTWAKEYIFSVGTQTIHAFVYTIFIGITYNMVLNVESAKMAVCILAFMFFRFMTEAEKMLRKFLKLTGGDSSSGIMGDAQSTSVKDLVGWAMLNRIYGYADKTPIPKYIKSRYKTGKQFMKHQFENEYVKMKRNEFIEKYDIAYKTDSRGRPVKVTGNIDELIDAELKKEYNYKLERALNPAEKAWGVLHGAGTIMVGIPIGIVESTLAGTALVATGASTLKASLGGAITGYKLSSEMYKYRAKDGTYRNIQEWINKNATHEVAKALREQYLYAENDYESRGVAKRELLNQARGVEVVMQEEIAKQKEGLLKGADGVDSTTKIQNELAKTYTKNLRKQIEDRMKTVDRKDIQSAVKDYMKKNKKYALTMQDFREIAEEIDAIQIIGKDIDAYLDVEGLTENIKQETVAKFISEVTEHDGLGNKITLDEETMDRVEESLIEKMDNTTDADEKRSLQLAVNCIEDKRKEMNGEEKLNVYSNLSQEEQNKVKGVLQEAANENDIAEKQVTGLNAEQIVDTIKKAVDKEGSVIKEHNLPEIPEFKPILEQVDKLKELNELAKDMGEPPICKDVGKLVEQMIKNTDVRLDKQVEGINTMLGRENDWKNINVRQTPNNSGYDANKPPVNVEPKNYQNKEEIKNKLNEIRKKFDL